MFVKRMGPTVNNWTNYIAFKGTASGKISLWRAPSEKEINSSNTVTEIRVSNGTEGATIKTKTIIEACNLMKEIKAAHQSDDKPKKYDALSRIIHSKYVLMIWQIKGGVAHEESLYK